MGGFKQGAGSKVDVRVEPGSLSKYALLVSEGVLLALERGRCKRSYRRLRITMTHVGLKARQNVGEIHTGPLGSLVGSQY